MVELFREEPEEELGLRIVGGKDTPLGNIVIQEIIRDSLAARDGRLAPGDHILEVRATFVHRGNSDVPWWRSVTLFSSAYLGKHFAAGHGKVDIQDKQVFAPW